MNFVVRDGESGAELSMFSSTRMALAAAALALALSHPAGSTRASAVPDELVDINRASVAELMRVPEMTHGWAQRIVRFRPYRSKLDLLDEGVVPAEVYRRIRGRIVAHGLKDGK
jgi:DNA uptake protein ComE-like DNA-binding protein